MAPTKVDMAVHRESLRKYTAHADNAKRESDRLISSLMEQLSEVSAAFEDIKLDKQREIEQGRQLQRTVQGLETELKDSQTAFTRDNSVLVLIDGDGMLFQDAFVRDGEAGGTHAAQLLYDTLHRYINTKTNVTVDVKIVVRIYANLEGLCRTYELADIASVSTVVNFTRGFTKARAHFDFVDVGAGKERADNKIGSSFNLYCNNVQTRHIFLGCSHDNGYARLLEELPSDRYNKVTLLEGVPFAREFYPFLTKIATENFDAIFRDDKLDVSGKYVEAKRVGNGSAAAASPALKHSSLTTHSSFSNGNANGHAYYHSDTPSRPASSPPVSESDGRPPYASAMAAAPRADAGGQWVVVKSTPSSAPQTLALRPSESDSSPPPIRRNRSGQRIDPPKPTNVDKDVINRIQLRKLCNNLYLKNDCKRRYLSPANPQYCTHDHDFKPTKTELEALRVIARRIPCVKGTNCDDPLCTAGHRCPSMVAGHCAFQDVHACKFSNDMHHNDTVEVKTTTVR